VPAHARPTVAIVLILILAAALRLHGIGQRSLWFDEAATVSIVGEPIPRMLDRIKTEERTPPLHYFLLWGWTRVFGNSEASVRLPSAIASTAAVGGLYLLVRRLFDWQAGAIAALLLAVSRYQIDYSQEARAYALMLLLALWSCDLFGRLMQNRTARLEAAYVIVTAALLYTHLYGVFAIIAQQVAYLVWSPLPLWERVRVRGNRADLIGNNSLSGVSTASPSPPPSPARGEGGCLSPRRWLLLNVAVLALFGPWIPTTITWTRFVSTSFWAPPMTPAQIGRTYQLYAGSWAVLALLVLLAIVGIVRKWDRRANALLLGLTLLPVFIPAIIGALTKPNFTDRYAIFAPAGLYALAAVGIASLRWKALRIAYVAALCVLSMASVKHVFEKQDWRSAGQYLTTSMRPTDVVAINRKNNRFLYDYYVRRPDVRLVGFDGPALPFTLPLPRDRHVWFIASNSAFTSSEMLARAPWRVLSHRKFDDHLEIFELTDAAATTQASQPTTSAIPPPSRSP
jgi:uncharacterized membrane protein